MLKKGLLILLLMVAGFMTWHLNSVIYGLRQLSGQIHILRNSVSVQEFLNDPEVPDSIKVKLELIQEVRQFAIDSLGVNDSENYTTIYDQKGKPVLWVLSASKPFKLEPKLWKFPFLGKFPYKGFFKYELALKEKQTLEGEWDTRIRTVTGWSTLGWAKDPIMSNMLLRDEGRLAELIIHELIHATLYIKDSVDFNENLASFLGEQGAIAFLKYRYGEQSEELINYRHDKEDNQKFFQHFLRGAQYLDSLYQTFSDQHQVPFKEDKKEEATERIVNLIDTIRFHRPGKIIFNVKETLPNNAYFLSFRRYRSLQDQFEYELTELYGGDIKNYISNLKETYRSL